MRVFLFSNVKRPPAPPCFVFFFLIYKNNLFPQLLITLTLWYKPEYPKIQNGDGFLALQDLIAFKDKECLVRRA